MAQAATRPWTVDDFLAWERRQEERYEWHDGLIRAMVGATLDHNQIVQNLVAALSTRLDGTPCAMYAESAKVQVGFSIAYPDAVITCSPQDGTSDMVEKPAIIIEVLSPSTESFDRGGKWALYQSLPSLQQYVLISQGAVHVETFERRDGNWQYSALAGLSQELVLNPIKLALPLSVIFRRTTAANSA